VGWAEEVERRALAGLVNGVSVVKLLQWTVGCSQEGVRNAVAGLMRGTFVVRSLDRGVDVMLQAGNLSGISGTGAVLVMAVAVFVQLLGLLAGATALVMAAGVFVQLLGFHGG
jgi:hypothetical protein